MITRKWKNNNLVQVFELTTKILNEPLEFYGNIDTTKENLQYKDAGTYPMSNDGTGLTVIYRLY